MITYNIFNEGFLWVPFSINTDKIWSTLQPRSFQNKEKESLTSQIHNFRLERKMSIFLGFIIKNKQQVFISLFL